MGALSKTKAKRKHSVTVIEEHLLTNYFIIEDYS